MTGKHSGITRRHFGRALGAASAAGAVRGAAPDADNTPNVILIMTDDQGWWDLGTHGNGHIKTPVMDRFMAEGVEFTRFYAAPVCAPCRASLMTGRYYPRTGVYSNIPGDILAADEVTLGQLFQKAGYRTGLFGKWHLGKHQRDLPWHRGFDDVLSFVDGSTERFYYPNKLRLNGRPVQVRGYITDVLTDAAISFLQANRENPFFLYVPYNAPHNPKLIHNDYVEPYLKQGVSLPDAQRYGMITRIDENIGRLLEAVDDEGLREDTIVIFLSDNGGLTQHEKCGLRGSKGDVYEGGIRVPFTVRWPGQFPAGAKVGGRASIIDIFPTMSALLNQPLPDDRTIDGKNLLPLFRAGSGSSPHKYLFHMWDSRYPKLDSNWAVSTERYKLVRGEELYDLLQDPSESSNIASQHPDVVRDLKQQHESWFRDVTHGQKFEPATIQVGREDENPVELQAGEAIIDGERTALFLRIDGHSEAPVRLRKAAPGTEIHITWAGYDWDSVDGWSSPGERARWDLDVVREGVYEVAISYGCHPRNAGGRFRLSVGEESLDGLVEPTLNRNVFWARKLGDIRLKRGHTFLEVRALSVPGDELMALNKIWLKRRS